MQPGYTHPPGKEGGDKKEVGRREREDQKEGERKRRGRGKEGQRDGGKERGRERTQDTFIIVNIGS